MKERNENVAAEFDEAGVKRKKGKTKGRFKRGLGVILAGALGLGVAGVAAPALNGGNGFDAEEVYAAAIGNKNVEAQQRCDDVANGRAPKKKDYSSTAAGNTGGLVANATDKDWYRDADGNVIDLNHGTDGYSDKELEYTKLLDGAVYIGGNAKSSRNNPGGNQLDNDPDDFASVLPYGNVFIDTSKLTFDKSNSQNFTIDIKDTANFTWVAPTTDWTVDSEGHTPAMAVSNYYGSNLTNAIAYTGGLKAYLSNTDAYKNTTKTTYTLNDGSSYELPNNYDWLSSTYPNDKEGAAAKVTADDGDYLYKFTFKNAATLPDGTLGNVVIKATSFHLEGSVDVLPGAPIGIHDANHIGVNPVYYPVDANGAPLTSNTDGNGVPLFNATGGNTAGSVVKAYIPSAGYVPVNFKLDPTNPSSATVQRTILPAFGFKLSFDVEIQDALGNPVEGSISYSTYDLDVASRQTFWGRVNTGVPANDYMFSEGLTINKGSQTYAVVPNYDHANGNNAALGKLVMPASPEITATGMPDFTKTADYTMNITKDATAAKGDGPADGVRFASNGLINIRNSKGTFDLWQQANGIHPFDRSNLLSNTGADNSYLSEALFNANKDLIASWGWNYEKIYTRGKANNSASKKAYRESETYIKADGKRYVKVGNNEYVVGFRGVFVKDGYDDSLAYDDAANTNTTKRLTYKKIFDQLKPQTYITERGDGSTFDSGFAVLLDSAGSSLTWSGAGRTDGQMQTQLFDTSVYTRVEQTHGTGGGIYLEGYNISNKCNPVMYEGSVSMGKDDEATVTIVPEDGYRVGSIYIGNTDKANWDAEKYIIDGDNVTDANGTVLGTFTGTVLSDGSGLKTGEVKVAGFKYVKDANGNLVRDYTNVDGDIIIERNADGTVDVTLPNVYEHMHVHADFDTDYHFYKVWKGGEPTKLDMTASQLAFIEKDVELPYTYNEVEGVRVYDYDNKMHFSINQGVYTADDGTVWTVDPTTNQLTREETAADGSTTTFTHPWRKEGNQFVGTDANGNETPWDITVGYGMDTSTSETFTVMDPEDVTDSTKKAQYQKYVEVLKADDANNTIAPGYEVWKITYPAKGVSDIGWPALPLENVPNPNVHNVTHIDRLYWFVTEKAPGWATDNYDNSMALAPGALADPTGRRDYYADSTWGKESTKNTAEATKIIQQDNRTVNAFMSPRTYEANSSTLTPFSWGGKITNVPSIVVEATKKWDDQSNANNLRQEIWMHIDGTTINDDGTTTLKRDVLPPQRIKASDGDTKPVTWGNKQEYTAATTGSDKVNVVGSQDKLPVKVSNRRVIWKRQADGSYRAYREDNNKDMGVVYWVNELKGYSDNGKEIEYTIRETLPDGISVTASDASQGLIGYTATSDSVAWNDLLKTSMEVDGERVPLYSGTIENELALTDFTITKNWYDAKDDTDHDADELKGAITLYKDGTDVTATYKDKTFGEDVYYTDNDGNEYEKVTAYKKDGTGELLEKLPTVETRNNEEVHIAYTKGASGTATTWTDDTDPTTPNVYTEVTAYKKLSDDTLTETEPASNGIKHLSITPGTKDNNGTEVTDTKAWTYKVVKLPKYAKDANGDVAEAVYSASETQFTGYKEPVYSGNVTTKTEEVTGDDGNPTSVTSNTGVKDGGNIANIQLIKVNVVKIWDDADNQDNKRGDIAVTLFQNGEQYTTTVAGQANAATLKKNEPSGKFAESKTTVDNDTWTWSDVWTELPYASDAGVTYNYTAQETSKPDGYESDQSTNQITLSEWNQEKDTLTFTATNKHDPEKIEFTVTKVWDDENDRDGKRPTNGAVTYTLKKRASDESAATALTTLPAGAKITQGDTPITDSFDDGVITVNTVGDDGATITISGLNKNAAVGNEITYYIEETAVDNYNVDRTGNAQTGTADTDITLNDETKTKVVTGSQTNGFTITNTYKPETASVKVVKVWNDGNNRDGKRPDNLSFTLIGTVGENEDKETVAIADATKSDYAVNKAASDGDDGSYTWENLPVYQGGEKIKYSVLENTDLTSAGYFAASYSVKDVELTKDKTSEVKVTNEYTPETISISAKKVWDDANDQDGIRKDQTATFTLNKEVPDGNDGTKLEAITKDSEDADVSAKEIEGTEGDASITWTNLYRYENGQEITYVVEEEETGMSGDKETGYELTKTDVSTDKREYTFTNTHTPATVDVSITKEWDDKDNQDGIRPSVDEFKNKLTLKAGDDDVTDDYAAKLTVTPDENDANKWTVAWTGLPKYTTRADDDSAIGTAATPITYTVDEAAIDGYSADKATGLVDGNTVKNTHVPATGKIVIKKIWDDVSDKDGKRPDELKVTLKSDNEPALSQEVTITKPDGAAANEWTSAEIPDLPVYKTGKNGEAVTYTIEETDAQLAAANGKVVGSEPKYSIKGYDPANVVLSADTVSTLTVTNTRTPEKIDIDVNKVWDDASDRDGMRPSEVQFTLTGKVLDAIVYQASKTLTGTGNEWTATFAALDKYHEGNEIAYTVIEEMKSALEKLGYTADESKGNKDGNYTITNSRDNEKVTITATKVFDDQDDKYGLRKDVTLSLQADGEGVEGSVKTIKANATGNDLTVSWTVDKYRNGGAEIKYTIVEADVSPYSQAITGNAATGYTVTNTYPAVTETKEVTRTIIYTYIDENGKEASKTVEQKVTLTRTPTVIDEENGIVEWSDWEIVDGDTSDVDSPEIDGWTPDKDNVPEWNIDPKDPKDEKVNVVYKPEDPTGTPDETYGGKGEKQTGTPEFDVTTKTTPDGSNKIEKVELLDKDGNPTDKVEVPEGTYELNDDGTITFTPKDSEFVGDPTPVKVKGTDSNGNTAETTYTPHVVDNTDTVTRTITYEYEDGTPVLDEDGNPKTEEQTVTFTGKVDPKTGKVTFPEDDPDNTKTFDKVDNPEIDGWDPDKTVDEKTVKPGDPDEKITVVYNPEGLKPTPSESYGLPGEKQTGTPTFTPDTPTLPDGTPNTVEEVKLMDPSTGEPTDTVTIPGQGTYKLNEDGTITFTPEDGFVGNPTPVGVIGKDKLGNTARTTYTPHVVDKDEKKTVTRTITYTYITEDGKEASKTVTQEVNLVKKPKSIDPKTGEVLEWEDTWTIADDDPDTKAKDSPEIEGWTPDDKTVPEWTIDLKDPKDAEEHVVYQPQPPTGTPAETSGKKDVPQTTDGKDMFEVTTPTTPDGTPNKIEKVELLDEDGNPTDKVEVPEGTYTVDKDGNITFTPKPGFTGTPTPVNVRGTDSNGETAETTYTPHVADEETTTVTRNIEYKYIDENGKEASKTVTQTVTLTRTPKTIDDKGNVTEWNDWEIDNSDNKEAKSPDKSSDGWDADRDVVPAFTVEYDEDGNPKQPEVVYVVYTPKDPSGTDDETYGGKGDPQTGKPEFDVTTKTTPDGEPNEIVEVKLIDPKTGEPTDEKTVTVDEGTYTLNDDGTVTFTPNDPEYVGDPTPVELQGTDKNGKTAKTTYTPHVVDNTSTVKRTITYEYSDGTPVLDEDGKPKTEEQTVTFTGTVDPKTGEVTYPDDKNTDTFDEVPSDEIPGYDADKEKIDKTTVKPGDKDITEKVIYSPDKMTGNSDTTYGLPGETQTGTPVFETKTKTTPDGKENKVEPDTIKLVDPTTGDPADEVKIPGQGTYKIVKDNDGNVTVEFVPEDGFVGNPQPIGVTAKDTIGNTAKTTYTPHVVDPTATDKATRTIHYTYLTDDGTEVAKDTTQTVTLTRHAKKVDPKTGEVLEWGDWESATFPAVENPDKEAGEGWTTDDSVAELTVTEPGKVKDENVIYEPEKPEATPLVTKDGQFDSKDQSGNTTNTQKVNVNDSFKVGTPKMPDGSDNTFTYTLDVPKDADGKPVPGATVSKDGTTVTVPGEGTYKLDPKTGEITFTPDKDFSGKTSGVTVKGTDKFGNTAETTYTPIVVPNKETVTLEREVEYTFWDDDGNEVTEKKTETITFTRVGDYNPAKDDDPEGYGNDKDNPDENETIDFPAWTPKTSNAPENPNEEGWKPDSTPEVLRGLTPDNAKDFGFEEELDADGNPTGRTVRHDEVVYVPNPPTGAKKESYGFPGLPQSRPAKDMFVINTPTTDETDENGNRVPNEIVEIKLKGIDPETGEEVEGLGPVNAYGIDPETGERAVVGVYTYDPKTGRVIFTPNETFSAAEADPEPVTLIGTDKNGLSAESYYQPHFKPKYERKPIERTIDYVYDNGDGTTSPVLDEEGNPLTVTQRVTFQREATSVDEETGELIWGDWTPEEASMPEVKSPTSDDPEGDTGKKATSLTGWYPDKDAEAVTGLTKDDGNPDNITVVYKSGPVGHDDTSRGPKGQPQEGQPKFDKGTGEIPEKGAYSLEEPDADNPNKKTVPGEGTYELDPDTGKVTFTPEPEFTGKGKGVTVKVTDENGLTATGKYTPTVYEKDDERTVTRTIHYRYLTKDGKEASADVVQSVKFVRKTDPNTGELGDWEIAEGSATFTEVVSPEITGYEFDVEKIAELTVTPDSENTDEYVIYNPVKAPVPEPPKGTEDETWGAPGEEQTSTPEFKFTEGTGKIPEKGAYSLEEPDADNPLKKTIPGEGTYELDPDTGKVTFTPEPDFRGKGTGVTVKVTDENGLSATGTYVPNVAENVDTTTVKRTITHEYADGTPVLDEDGKPVVTVQTVTFSRVGTVDPDTGEVTYPDWTEEKTLDEEKALDRLLSTHTAVPDSVGELKVTGKSGDLTGKIVYTPIPDHTVTYIDNLTGEVITVDKNVPHHGDSTVPAAPAHDGYTFEGWRLPDGSIVKDLKVSDVTTDLVYEAVYKPVDPDVRTWTVTYVDNVTGEVIKVDKPVDDHGSSAVPTPPEHDGYRFKGWLTPDGKLVTDLSVEDVTENLLYTAVYDRVYEEAVTIARTIHYRYIDKDGKEVVEDKIQDIRFTREAIVDGVTGETTFTEWNPRFHTFNPVESPEVEGWVPDREVIEEQTVYPDGSNEELWVIYTPIEYSEQKELSRTVYYTYYTRDGEEASMPVKQTLKIERKYTIDPETKEKVYGEWYIVDEASEADIPEIEGFTPDLSEIPEFKVDLTVDEPVAPEDVHVVYNKVDVPTDPEKITYTVTFVDGFGTTLKVQDGIDLHGTAEAPENPEHEGYRFTGWDVKFDDITGNIIVTALWEPIPETYWVTYVDPDGKTIYLEKTTVNKGEDEPEAPKDPVKDGFEFGGWDRSVDADGNITYTAIWKKPGEPDPTTTTEEPTTTTTVVAEPTTAANPASPTVPVTGSAVRPTTVQNPKTGQSVTVVPAGTASPDTGDKNNAPVWIVIAIAAAGTAATAAIVRRRRRED